MTRKSPNLKQNSTKKRQNKKTKQTVPQTNTHKNKSLYVGDTTAEVSTKKRIRKYSHDNERVANFKEFIAPSVMERGNPDYLIVGSKYTRTFYLEGFPEYVGIGYMSNLYDTDYDVDVNISIIPRSKSKSRKELQDKLTIVKAQLEEEIERNANRNRDTYTSQIVGLEQQIAELTSGSELPFDVQIFFTLYTNSKEELERQTSLIIPYLKEAGIVAQPFALRMDKGFKTVVPYGIDYIQDKKRNFNTGAIVSSIPFYTPELYDEDGVYLGDNTISGLPVQIDLYKKGIPNSNLNIFGSSGSGKSTLVKALTLRSALYGIRTVIIDPEGEYSKLTEHIDGGVVRLTSSTESSVMMNIFDVEESELINESGQKIETLDLKSKYEDVLGFIRVCYPHINPGQEANILEVIEELYLDFGFVDGDPKSLYYNDDVVVRNGRLENTSYKKPMPTISDLIDLMNVKVLGGEYVNLKDVMDALRPYQRSKTRGMFDTQTPDSLKDLGTYPVINFDIQSIEQGEVRTIAMYVILSWVWEKFGKKFPDVKKRIVVDEAWMMMDAGFPGSEYSSRFLETMSRRIRKRNGALCIATQKVEDFSSTRQGSSIISNAYTTFLLGHETGDKRVLMEIFELDEGVVENIINVKRGRVLIRQGNQLFLADTHIFENELKMINQIG